MTDLTAIDIAREILPTHSDEELNTVLWEWTGFPNFFVSDIETGLRQQLAFYRDSVICNEWHGCITWDPTCSKCGGKRRVANG